MNLHVMVLLGLGLYFVVMYLVETKQKESKTNKKETIKPTAVKETISLLDYQFDTENFPSSTYSQMFYSSTPWLHGRGLGDGKIYITRDVNIQEPLNLELSQNELNQVLTQLAPTPAIITTPANSTAK